MLAVTMGYRDHGVSELSAPYRGALEKQNIDYFTVDCEKVLRASEIAKKADGLLIIGGGDTNPLYYGKMPDPHNTYCSPMRDRNEIALCLAFVAENKPVFGICRGMQVINVALGGTLHQHIDHRAVRRHALHLASATPLMPDAHAATYHINSYHHQAVDRLAPNLVAIGHAFDGTIEAFMGTTHPILAVQWHPERDEIDLGDEFFIAIKKMCGKAAHQ